MLGGWLTDNYSWRWVFYINVPFGILAVLGVLAYFPEEPAARRFDFFGFATLSIAVGTLQLLLDRGPVKDWFSTEIKLYAVVLRWRFYLFAVHTLTDRERPFIRLALYRTATSSPATC
jgi:MFS transporter, DHA2 family, multidrug resistance protein